MISFRLWRYHVPARASEVLAAVSLTTTFMLYIHTYYLQSQLHFYTSQLGATGVGSGSSIRFQLLEKDPVDPTLAKKRKQDSIQLHLDHYHHLDPRSLNITKPDTKLTLMFNRVPKVGSQSTMELLRSLGYKNGFTFHKDRPQKSESIKMSRREQKRLAHLVDIFRPPSVYVKHVCFINFTELNFSQPIYINMVRDPVERAISWYYYVRAPWYFVERKEAFPELPLPSASWLRKDYESCVLKNDKECQYLEGEERPDFSQLTEFFCGQDPECTGFNTEYAMKKAKKNVEKHYAVVGVLEELNVTLTVLEHYLPRFFAGALDVYWNQIHRFSKVNKNIYKPKVRDDVKEIVRKNFTREIEFYDFCKQRLYKQYAALNLPLND